MKKEIKEVAIEILEASLSIDDEMLSVELMTKYKITPEEYVIANNLAHFYIKKAKEEIRKSDSWIVRLD